MPIEIRSNVNYQEVCKELGISLEDLLALSKKKNSTALVSKYTAYEVIDKYMEVLLRKRQMGKRSAKTWESYQYFFNQFKRFLQEFDSPVYIHELNDELFEQFLLTCQPIKTSILTNGTRNTYTTRLRSLLRFAYEMNYVSKDIRRRFEFEKVAKTPRYFTTDQIKRILDEALQCTHGYRWNSMFSVFLGTGCRVSELSNLKIEDIDWESKIIFIRKGKGNKERYIPLYPEVEQVLLDYLRITGVPKIIKDMKGYVFSKIYGTKREKNISVRSINRTLRSILQRIGCGDEYTVHSFRHTFAVNCLKAGMNIITLCQVLGHEDPKTTSIYTCLLPRDLQEEVMKSFPFPFEQLLNELILRGEATEDDENFTKRN
jgi:site-specific recombinase XerD